MKKFYYFLATLLCFPYFSMFVWSPADISDFTTSHLLSAQESTSSDASVPYYLKKIGADDTADTLAGYPIKDTVVAIIDTGAELSHEDLADSLWVNDAERNGTDNIDDDGNGFIDDVYGVDFVNNVPTPVPDDASAPLRYDAPEDDSNSSHGTHVSGIVGMNPENESGSVGVGYHTKIMILKAGNSKNSFSFSNATKAVKYAVANGADVINMSFGSYNQNDLFASELEEASHSCLLVAAAGNNGKASSVSLMYPAAYPYVIGVMAGNTTDGLWAFSNYVDSSPAPYDIVCPGESILSTARYNSYEEKNGTSMASPMAAGSAAVIMGFLQANKLYDSRESLLEDTKKYLLMSDSVYTTVSESGLLFITPRLNLKNSLSHIIKDLGLEEPTATPSASSTNWPLATFSAVPATSSAVAPSVSLSTLPAPTFPATPAVTLSATPAVTLSATPAPTFSATPAVTTPAPSSIAPSATPTLRPSAIPSGKPSSLPSIKPTGEPPTVPSATPSVGPSFKPSAIPSIRPSVVPSVVPSIKPSAKPTREPLEIPTIAPSAPSKLPSASPKVSTVQNPTKTPAYAVPKQPISPSDISQPPVISSKPAKVFNPKTLRMKISKIKKKKSQLLSIKWKKTRGATRYQIRIKNKKKEETRWIYTKKTKITLKQNKYIQISIRAQKVIGKKIWSGPYKRI